MEWFPREENVSFPPSSILSLENKPETEVGFTLDSVLLLSPGLSEGVTKAALKG